MDRLLVGRLLLSLLTLPSRPKPKLFSQPLELAINSLSLVVFAMIAKPWLISSMVLRTLGRGTALLELLI
ncbi:hypothetical protein LINGRAHAP2_LOCUS33338 [Linum grandiflorum]